MNENPQNFDGAEMKMPTNAEVQPEPSKLINGPLLLMLTVLLVMVLTAMYMWFSTMTNDASVQQTSDRPTALENNEPESTTAEAQTDTMLTTSSSDEISAIQADIAATNLDNLDTEMIAIEAQMDASLQSN